MNESDKRIFTKLINKYGIKELEWLIESNKELLNYMIESKEKKIFFENLNEQIFTNGNTSVFYLNQKKLDFDILKQVDNPPTLVGKDEINKYFEKSEKLFGNWKSPIYLKNDHGLVFYKNLKEELITITLNEYKLLKLLLKSPKIYASLKNTLIYAESEYGHAYILSKKNREQLIY